MKFKDLTEADKKYAYDIYTNKDMSWDDRMIKLMDFFGKSERTVRKWCSEKLNFKEKVDIEPEQYVKAKERKFDKNKKRFIITWAQNNTPVHSGLLKNIEAYILVLIYMLLLVGIKTQHQCGHKHNKKKKLGINQLLLIWMRIGTIFTNMFLYYQTLKYNQPLLTQ